MKVGILGSTGYTALELIKILLRHPEVEITTLTSRQEGSPHVSSVHPQLFDRLDLCIENLAAAEVAERCDCVFSCLPHAASAELVAEVLQNDSVRVVDFSADYRLSSLDVYHQWYGGEHPDPDRIGHVPYGLPELFANDLEGAPLVANPGCNPTGPMLALAPLLDAKLIQPQGIIVDCKAGVSGAGRTPKLATHYPECNESVKPYNVGKHRHTPEFDDILNRSTGQDVKVIFTPHLVPMERGILTTTYAVPIGSVSAAQLTDCLQEFYNDKPFVRIVDHLPATRDTAYTNYCDIHVEIVSNVVTLIASVDNLMKGASGAAVQNMNCMFGYDQTTALLP